MDAKATKMDANDPRIIEFLQSVQPESVQQPVDLQHAAQVHNVSAVESTQPTAPAVQQPMEAVVTVNPMQPRPMRAPQPNTNDFTQSPAQQVPQQPVQQPMPQPQQPQLQTYVEEPVDVILTMPGGAPIPQPQVQPIKPVDIAELKRMGKIKKSPFRSAQNFAAGHITIEETTYWYREITPPLQDWMQEQFKQLSEKLGITPEALANDDYSGANSEELFNLHDHYENITTPVLQQCIVDWDAVDDSGQVVPVRPEYIADLGREVKTELMDQIQRSTEYGISFDQFRRRSGGRFSQRASQR